jgi:DNA modification methylase
MGRAGMTPYYDDGGSVIYHGDCRDVLPVLSFDAVVSDPPYGVLAESGSAATRRSGGNKDNGVMAWDVAPERELLDVLLAKPAMLWGGCHLDLPPTVGYLIWDKQIDGLNFGEVEYCWTNMKFAPRVFRYRAVGVDGGKVHPTQKPEALMLWCIGFLPATSKTIVDPYMGSGTTLVAAKRIGRHAVGIEREERYCEIAARRLSQGALDLFGETA